MMPDKIYVQPNAHDRWFEGNAPNELFKEYIRKDALLEWAKEKQYESLTIVADNFWQEVIDKLNSV